ncbi:MAG: type II toxin-antitoxin system VapC family toxin [Desulfobacterales bacterium]
MKRVVYIETTIPSFYQEVRTEPEMIARRNWTREWWNNQREHYQLVTSIAVIEELERGDYPNKEKILNLVADIPLLSINTEIHDIVETYIKRKLMPADILGDALHLAIASFHGCDFLLTWNCKHLANANKFSHIRRLNALLGLYVPALITPVELLSWEE